MIDVHCHLEQEDFSRDREKIIELCRKDLKAIITSCANPGNFGITMKMREKNPGFVFVTLGLHPTDVLETGEKRIEDYIEKIRANRNKICGIGEVGLDYNYIKGENEIKRTKEFFLQFIELAKELKLPLVVHARDAFEDAIKILEDNDARNVLMHCFGALHLAKRVEENKWYISIPPIIYRSKKHRKLAKRFPLELILTETDSPWLAPEGGRNDPRGVRVVVEKIAKERGIPFEEVDRKTTENAIKFFSLNI